VQNSNVVKMPQATQVVDYNITDAALEALKEKNRNMLKAWDGKDFDVIKEHKKEALKLRTGIEPMRKEKNADALAWQRAVNAEAARIVKTLEEIEKPLDDILDAEKARIDAEKQAKLEADRKRVQAIQDRIALIKQVPNDCINKPAQVIQNGIDKLNELIANDAFDYEELALEASSAKRESAEKLVAMHTERAALEKQQAEEAAAIEAKRLAQIAEDERLAEERRIFAEQQEQIRLANEAMQAKIDEERRRNAEEVAKRQAELAERSRKLQEQEEKLRLEIEAEEQRKADEAAKLEREVQETETALKISFSENPPLEASNSEEKINAAAEAMHYLSVFAKFNSEQELQQWYEANIQAHELPRGGCVFSWSLDDESKFRDSNNALIEEIEKTVTLLGRTIEILPVNEASALAMRADLLNATIKQARGN
jgi:hypothetical protein